MESPVILTIITPVFNGSKWLPGCLENVANQWLSGIEHLIVDGGSQDDSKSILQKYSNEYAHIHWVSEKDKGQSDAMNKGIRMAKGTWISFLNVDDFYEPDILPKILKKVQLPESQNSILVGNLKIWNANGTLQKINKPSSMSLSLLLADICEWPYNPSAYFYPKSVHEKIGYFPENEHYAMDYDFILKVAFAKIPFKYFNETWGNFRLLPEAKTSTDQVSNTSYERAKLLRESIKKQLSFSQHLQVELLILFWKVRNKLWFIFRS